MSREIRCRGKSGVEGNPVSREIRCRGKSGVEGNPVSREIRCRGKSGVEGNPVSREIRCRFIILARKDEPTPDYAPLRASLVERAEDCRWSSLHVLSTDSSGRSGWTRARCLGAPAGWRTSTPRCLTMMLPEYANPYDETARWAIPPGRWRLPGPWAWNPASAHPAARPGLQWSDQDPREQSAGGSPTRKDRTIQDPEVRLPISPIAPQKLPVSPFDSLDSLRPARGRSPTRGGSGDRSARLDTVGMSVTRTPLTLRSITSAALPNSQLRLKPPDGKLQSGKHLVERRLPLGVENPCREHPAIHSPW